MDPRSPFTIDYPATSAGLQQWHWDLHAADLSCIDGHFLFDGYAGPAVAPGEYQLRVTAGDQAMTVPVSVLPDPRVAASAAEVADWVGTQEQIAAALEQVLTALDQARRARSELQALITTGADAELQALASAAIDQIDAWESEVTELRHQTLEDEDAWVMKIDGQLRHLLGVVESGGAPVTSGARTRFEDLTAQWSSLQTQLAEITDRLQAVNLWAAEHALPHVTTPAAGLGPAGN